MLSWASYLFGGSSTAEPQNDEKEFAQAEQVAMDTDVADKEWVVVDHKDCYFGNHLAAQRSHVTCYPGMYYHGDSTDSDNISPSKSDSSSCLSKHSTPNSLSPVSHSRHLYVRTRQGRSNEAWILTPPSCFTAGDGQATQVGVTDLENLLIEHPSMSVYKRSGSEGEDSNVSDSSNEPINSKRSQALSKSSPKRLRAVSAKAELLAQVSQVKQAQKKQQVSVTKRNKRRALEKANKVAICDKHVTRKSRVRNPSGQMNGRVSQRKQ